jgi:hypothetical protein
LRLGGPFLPQAVRNKGEKRNKIKEENSTKCVRAVCLKSLLMKNIL